MARKRTPDETSQTPNEFSQAYDTYLDQDELDAYIPQDEDEDNVPLSPDQALAEFRNGLPEEEPIAPPKESRLKQLLQRKARKAPRTDPASKTPPTLGPVFRRVVRIVFTLVLLSMLGLMIFVRVDSTQQSLRAPEHLLAKVMTPIQAGFSSLVNTVVEYLHTLKLRANLEAEYNKLRQENERLVYQALLVEELQQQLSQYENISDEMDNNRGMNPIICSVIGMNDGNYFATFTINKGKKDGIENYMAVTINGNLIGYTENVTDTKSSVRAIIDSEASIAGIIESSRDQGTIRGTLGVDGTPMCRMYYLDDDKLPRPGDLVVTSGVGLSFPKGIPIGTVKESTRGMDANKQYIVISPLADFEHIEYVIVLRYQPAPEAIQGKNYDGSKTVFVPLETARPYPTLRIGAISNFGDATPRIATSEPLPTPSLTPPPETPEPIATPAPLPTLFAPSITYNRFSVEPTPTPTVSPTPSPTPYITPDPGGMEYEDDE